MADHHRLRHRKGLVVLYLGGAVALVPWISYLYLVQAPRGLAHNVAWLTGGLLALIAAGAVSTAALWFFDSPAWMVGASLTASLAFATAWFHLSAPSHTHSTAVTIRTFVVLGLPLALFAWALSVWLAQPRGEKGSLALGFAYVVAGVLLALGAARFVSFAPPTEAVFHLRLMWCGLDVFEAVGMALTGWFLHTRSRHVVVAAAATGALLLADAWSNVTATASTAREAALAMAVVEVSLAVLSVVVAVTVAFEAHRMHLGRRSTPAMAASSSGAAHQ
jgi:hypothetical protein